MCSSKPKTPKIETPPPPQAAQAPDSIDKNRRNNANGAGAFAAAPGGTLLTGPSGAGKATTGKSTLLGG